MTAGPVLVAVDTSENARVALEWAAEYAAVTSSPLVVVHALGLLDRDPSGAMVPSQPRRAEILDWLTTLAADVASRREITATSALCDGEPVSVVLAEAARVGAGLIVVGTRGVGHSPLMLGSTSEQLARRAPCPVTIVP